MPEVQTSSNERPKNWSDLSHEDFSTVYPVIESNARRHYHCAQLLADAHEYANAIAHLILGTEELIKTFGTLLAAKKTGIKQQSWFGKLFYHHKTRHDLIKDFFSIYLLFKPMAGSWSKKSGFWATLGKSVLHLANVAANFFWWKDADNLKQRAFYVDYAGKIIDPADICVEDYKKALRYVQLFEQEITDLMREIEKATPIELAKLFEDLDFNQIDKLRKQAYDLEKRASQITS